MPTTRDSTERSKRVSQAWAVLLILSLPLSGYGQGLPPVEVKPGGPAYMPGEVLLQFKPSVTDAQLENAFRQGELGLIKHVRTPAMQDHGLIGLIHAATARPVLEVIRALNEQPGVAFAEPNWVYAHQAESNDPYYLDGSLWGMYSDDAIGLAGPVGTTNPYGSQAEQAWALGIVGSQDVFVGIVDEGIQHDHPDLAANLWTNPGEIPDNAIDDDGNGYIDDVHGWNAIDDNGAIYDPAYDDHGTHVAGTLGAVGGNGLGVAGVNWKVTLISGKFLSGSGTALDAVQAIDYMTSLKTRKGLNIVALNNSWGGGAFSQALLDAVTRAAQAEILFAAAAMNWTSDNDSSPVYPASFDTTGTAAGYDAVIAVAAIDSTGALASFSDYGFTSVDLGAPGVGIYSTLPGGTYGAWKGTSMATPHVTGAIALYASTHPAATALEIRNALLTVGVGVRTVPALVGKTVTGGALDVGHLVAGQAPLEAPLPPGNAGAGLDSQGRVTLSWTDQSDNELGFAIERANGSGSYLLADTVGANMMSYLDGTAQPGVTYSYRIRAFNAGGSSDPAVIPDSVTTPPATLPAAPSNLAATALARSGGVVLTWVDRSNNENGFVLQRHSSGSTVWQSLANVGVNINSYTDGTALPRKKYTYRVGAFNAAGVSTYAVSKTVTAK